MALFSGAPSGSSLRPRPAGQQLVDDNPGTRRLLVLRPRDLH